MTVNSAYDPAGRHRGDIADGDIRARVQQLTLRQQRFERSIAKRLEVDGHGLEALDHLIATGPLTPTDLAHRLGVSTAAMTLVLNRLEDSGHVRRERHPSDGRKLLVIASEGSSDQAQQMVLPLVEGVEEIIASMSEQERAATAGFLDELIRLYDQTTPPPN
ncbi:MarR family winged helix-turn-helix transcriptional regulator [Psychromicrobium xiongbiense]|uniref:MarR family winged helix-turn-helix transcriptional regulator n=1 Tax=Psychromicrobium xiongbiense TaxID=3051184 RepID=UPI0025531653|nr:MarR family transcriptional regulator [Psychromicrobium sp. YIM S02556]